MATITSRKKKDGTISYTAQIRLKVDGKNYTESKSGRDKKALSIWATKREDQLRQPGYIEQLEHKGTTIKKVLEWYKEDFNGSSKFGRSKLSNINFLIGLDSFSGLDAINLTAADLIKHAQGRDASPTTINNDFVWLRNAMRAVRLSRNIPLNIQAVDDAAYLLRKEKIISRSKQRNRRPSIEELEQLLKYFAERDKRSEIPMVEIVLFALFSSRRQEEICRMLWEDLDVRREGVIIRDMKHPREKTDTFVFMTSEAWQIIQRQPKVAPEIFPYNSKTVSSNFTRGCNFLEITDLRFHDLRHESASWMFELGWDIPEVAKHTGHRSWTSLQRYTHLREKGRFNKFEGWKWFELNNTRS